MLPGPQTLPWSHSATQRNTHALHAYAPAVPQVIMSQEMHVSLSDISDLPEGSNITITRTFPCVFQGWQQVAKVAVSLATGRWEELQLQEEQMVLVERVRCPVMQGEGWAKHGGFIGGCQSLEPSSFHVELQTLSIFKNHGQQDSALNRTRG